MDAALKAMAALSFPEKLVRVTVDELLEVGFFFPFLFLGCLVKAKSLFRFGFALTCQKGFAFRFMEEMMDGALLKMLRIPS